MNHPLEPGLKSLAEAGLGSIALTVNGRPALLNCAPPTRLAHALRDELGLTGTKIGCDAGDCGACTVLLDGKQVCSCITAVAQCAGREVTTIEGLAQDGKLNRLQQAFLKYGAAQCGICTPGMLMAASDLLAGNAAPTQAEVEDALGGVLCRCTGYQKIVESVLAVAHDDLTLEPPTAGRAVGSRLARLDGVSKLTGAEKYGADEYPAGALWLRVVRSPHARAGFTLGDLDAFRRKYPQIEGFITAADVPENSFCVFPVPKDQPVLADGHVRFRGEAVLGLLGERDAIIAIPEAEMPITWQPRHALTEPEEALTATGDLIHDFAPENVLCRGRVVKGDVQAAFPMAAHVVEENFRTSYVEHAYIEPEAGYAEVVSQGGQERLRLFVCTQTPYMDKEEVARVLKLPHDRVRVVPSAIGGGFGGKLDISVQPLLAVAAWKLKRPVRIVYTRPESMASTPKRHPSRIRVRLGCDKEGKLTAMDFAGDFNTGAYASWGSTVANRVPIHASGPYALPNVRALTRAVYTNNAIAGAFRGFGVPQACIATETLMDELAEKCGIDALEFRYRNAIRAGDATACGQVLQASAGLDQCLDALRPAWAGAKEASAAFNGQAIRSGSRKRRGAGLACMWYGIGNTVIANPSTMTIGLRASGRVVLYNGAQEIGQGTYTIMPQIAADALGVPVSLIDQVHSDTDLTEDAGKSSASRQTFVSGNAAKFAAEDLRRQLLQLAGTAADATLRLEGTALIAGTSRIDLQGLTPINERGDLALGSGYFNPPTVPLDADGQGVPYATFAFAAQLAEVEVDLDYGTVKVLHIHAAHDVGRAVNPTQVEGQIHGGIAQGLGLALMEEYISGKTDNLHDYLIPTVGDMPRITTYLIEDAEPLGPYGAKGVGEPALVPTAPAIYSAIRAATGVRVRLAPATPDRLKAALKAHEAGQRL
ncbi:MAG: molybdopterin-dependent oxidoreductase [Betaproteobacteria bacterium]|nr:molybdopterin-dependent oxidoreductase [Betaproteobacteria bacterium]